MDPTTPDPQSPGHPRPQPDALTPATDVPEAGVPGTGINPPLAGDPGPTGGSGLPGDVPVVDVLAGVGVAPLCSDPALAAVVAGFDGARPDAQVVSVLAGVDTARLDATDRVRTAVAWQRVLHWTQARYLAAVAAAAGPIARTAGDMCADPGSPTGSVTDDVVCAELGAALGLSAVGAAGLVERARAGTEHLRPVWEMMHAGAWSETHLRRAVDAAAHATPAAAHTAAHIVAARAPKSTPTRFRARFLRELARLEPEAIVKRSRAARRDRGVRFWVDEDLRARIEVHGNYNQLHRTYTTIDGWARQRKTDLQALHRAHPQARLCCPDAIRLALAAHHTLLAPPTDNSNGDGGAGNGDGSAGEGEQGWAPSLGSVHLRHTAGAGLSIEEARAICEGLPETCPWCGCDTATFPTLDQLRADALVDTTDHLPTTATPATSTATAGTTTGAGAPDTGARATTGSASPAGSDTNAGATEGAPVPPAPGTTAGGTTTPAGTSNTTDGSTAGSTTTAKSGTGVTTAGGVTTARSPSQTGGADTGASATEGLPVKTDLGTPTGAGSAAGSGGEVSVSGGTSASCTCNSAAPSSPDPGVPGTNPADAGAPDISRPKPNAPDPGSPGSDVAGTNQPNPGTPGAGRSGTSGPPSPPQPPPPPPSPTSGDPGGVPPLAPGRGRRWTHAIVVVDLATALGLADQPGWVPGYGHVPAPLARELAASASHWQRFLLDDDQQLISTGTTTYRPSDRMRELVTARDHTCTFPNCGRPAADADLDHRINYNGSNTTPPNLHPLCRTHHRLKTHHGWTVTRTTTRPANDAEGTGGVGETANDADDASDVRETANDAEWTGGVGVTGGTSGSATGAAETSGSEADSDAAQSTTAIGHTTNNTDGNLSGSNASDTDLAGIITTDHWTSPLGLRHNSQPYTPWQPDPPAENHP